MFDRFTERARHVIVLAQDEARTLRHNYVGTEHVLLGLLREEEGIAARVLGSLDVTLEAVRADVLQIVGEGEEVAAGQIPFTPRAKKALELSLREAKTMGHHYIGTEHVLLGIARENSGVAARILLDAGIDAQLIRDEVVAMLGGGRPKPTVPHSNHRQWLRRRSDFPVLTALVLGWSLFGIAAGLGLLAGWLIWG